MNNIFFTLSNCPRSKNKISSGSNFVIIYLKEADFYCKLHSEIEAFIGIFSRLKIFNG